jgi:serine/threonine protein kinase
MAGRYQVLERVGIGGMGEGYRARDTRLDRIVAIKTIAVGFVHDVTAAPRFERERWVATSLEHPHICRLLDTESQDGIDACGTFGSGEKTPAAPASSLASDRSSVHVIRIIETLTGFRVEKQMTRLAVVREVEHVLERPGVLVERVIADAR